MATPEFLTALERRGSAPALILAGGRVVDYADLARRAQAFAQEIEAPRALVAMEAAPSEHFVIGLVGALLAGHAVAILPPDAETRAEFTLRFAPEMVWRPTDGRWRLLRCEPAAAVAPHPDLAVLLLTSGSTGSARAVRLSGSALHANATAIADYLGLEASDRAGLTLPLHYSYGLSVLNSHLAVGASVWMPTGPILDEGLVAGLRQQACTNLAGVPFSYELYERVGLRAADLPQLRLMTVAGGRIDAARVGLYDAYLRAKGGRFFVMYGQTEATARIGIGPDDSFASLGGDSLQHVELAMMLESLLGHLPARWETMPIAELARPPRDPAERTGARIDPDLLLRAVAIVFVVIHHATPWPIPVGSSAMMVLVGFGLARYQLAALSEGGVSLFLRPLVAVLAPYYAIVAAHTLASGQLPWASLLLIGNFGFADPARGDMLPYLYWFVEVFVQLMLALATAFLIPVVRRTALASPFRFGLALLAVALAARVIGPVLWPLGGRQIFTLPWVLPMAAFGWCAAAAATGRDRLLVLGLAAVVLPGLAWHGGNWVGSWVRYGAQFLVLAALMFAPPIRTPARVAAPVLAVAAASYWIYLLHRIVPEMLLAPLQTQVAPAVFAALAVAGGVSIGIGAHVGFRAARRRARSASGGGWRRLAYLTPDAGDAPPPSRFRPG